MYREIESKEVKIRKLCLCNWCGEKINIGEKAQSRAYVFKGYFNRDKLHPECFKAMDNFSWKYSDGEFEPHEFKRGTCESKYA
jgi:hypothetical protein